MNFVAVREFCKPSVAEKGKLIRALKSGENVAVKYRADEEMLKAEGLIMDEDEADRLRRKSKPVEPLPPSINEVNKRAKTAAAVPTSTTTPPKTENSPKSKGR